MPNIRSWFIPKEERFFDLLIDQSSIVLAGAQELREYVTQFEKLDGPEREVRVLKIKELEERGDVLQYSITEKLNVTFITPVDKEDIYRLTILLDDLIDLIDVVVRRFILLNVETMTAPIVRLTAIVFASVEEVHRSVVDLRKLSGVQDSLLRIRKLEKEADDIYHKALYDLFHKEKDAINVIRYRELYGILEGITDKCKEFSQVVESIVVKHA
jgi:uncharacterized protein Yka (UPF0111/DUF47 family)